MLLEGCLPCDVLKGKLNAPGGIIYQDDYWIVEHSLSPVLLRGYLIIKLKRHCEHLADLTPEEAISLGAVMQNTCLALSLVIKPAKIHVCSWGEQVKHIHFHVIPRTANMPVGNLKLLIYLRFKKIFNQIGLGRWVSDQEAAEVAAKIRQEMVTDYLPK
ncbi:HIT family protein [Nostoc sp. FACHB-152]|uniref:HIT family protein n=1 Tax=unclassified Nostoc TaxID=2593658 RepID=UPI00168905A4|nr:MULTISPECIES: HIT family protein [unclassified Nostoc]MBD2451277.1 HIT family protein [Nostoc sp. FACHB-152]MBD2466948.1 HIT family protein [Nostoc sp. FACHB-145]